MAQTQKLLVNILSISLVFLLSGNLIRVHGWSRHQNLKPTKLFVFGDSYVDTGNTPKNTSSAWKEPYGITFPGKPAGRWSNGRLWTDYVAKHLGLKSPIPYQFRHMGGNHLRYGMNFAYGGTGVFHTLSTNPNMTVQIDYFEQLIKGGVYTSVDLNCSLALVSVAGNDYFTYLAENGSDFEAFISKVVNQTVVHLQHIRALGVKKIAVDALQPIGCIPYITSPYSYKQCDNSTNKLVQYHNLLLQQAVESLNNKTKNTTFVIIDLHSAFSTILENHGTHPGSSEFPTPLTPCCQGTNSSYNCGDVDTNGLKLYTVCTQPDSSFFWDKFHPTQAAWHDVYLALVNELKQII